MKKNSWILQYVLAILEGILSGMCFYVAWQVEKKTRRMVLLVISGVIWFANSVVSVLQGSQELKEMKKINGGDENE